MTATRSLKALVALVASAPAICGCSGTPAATPESPAVTSPSAPSSPGGGDAAAAPDQKAQGDRPALPVGPSDAPAPSTSSAAAATPAHTASTPASASEPPLDAAEKKEMERRCRALTQALNAATGRTKGARRDPVEVLKEVLAKPPKMPAADLERCGKLLERSIRDYEAAMLETEARTVMEMLSRRVMSAYLDQKKLCPSAAPVPARVELVTKGAYTSTPADWATPGWQCLGFDFTGQAQRFQYEVRSDPAALTFELVARGSPKGDGTIHEYAQRGAVKTGKLELTPFARR
jgi:hypothetical protein